MNFAFVSTGGTIATTVKEDSAKPRLQAEDLVADVPTLGEETQVSTFDIFTKPSTHITPGDMLDITELLHDLDEDDEIDAIIITHGTDTIEETAFFLDVTYAGETPVLLTGAMRKSMDTGADGPANILAAIQFAQHDQLKGIGPVLVMADQAFAAREVAKVHANTISAFGSPGHGPIGTIVEGTPRVSYLPTGRADPVSPRKEDLPERVVIETASAGMSPLTLRAAREADAVVIAGTGGGRIPPSAVEPVEELRERNIPVVMVPRSPAGYATYDTYDFPGAGNKLKEIGVLFSHLSPWKARLKVMAGMASDRPLESAMIDPG